MSKKGKASKLRNAQKKLHKANLERRRLALENRQLRDELDRLAACWVYGCAHDDVECLRSTAHKIAHATPTDGVADGPSRERPPAPAGATSSKTESDPAAAATARGL